MKYETVDSQGNITGFYDDRRNVIPDGAIKITDEEWRLAVEGQQNITRDTLSGERKSRPPMSQEQKTILDQTQRAADREIDLTRLALAMLPDMVLLMASQPGASINLINQAALINARMKE